MSTNYESPKEKRFLSDLSEAQGIIKGSPVSFNLACLIYMLHGSTTKQWGYSTNRINVIIVMLKSLDYLNRKLIVKREITIHCSYPEQSIHSLLKTRDVVTTENWIKQKWSALLPNDTPYRFTFHPRRNSNQRAILPSDPPGSIEIRLQKSKAIMRAYIEYGENLITTEIHNG